MFWLSYSADRPASGSFTCHADRLVWVASLTSPL